MKDAIDTSIIAAGIALAAGILIAAIGNQPARPIDGPWCSSGDVAWPAEVIGTSVRCDPAARPSWIERLLRGPYCPTAVTIGDALHLAGCRR